MMMIVKRCLIFSLLSSVGKSFQAKPRSGSSFVSTRTVLTTSTNYDVVQQSNCHETKPRSLMASTTTDHPRLSRHPRVPSIWNRTKRGLRRLLSNRRLGARLAALAMALLLFVGSAVGAPSGGRVGGSRSFRPTTTSRSSGMYRPPTTTMRRPPPQIHHKYRNRPMIPSYYGYGRNMRPDPRIHVVRRRTDGSWGPQDIAVVGVAGAAVTYGVVNQLKDQWNEWPSTDSPLGPGMTVGSLTVALEVPNRRDPSNILTRLNRLAVAADTVTQEGLADLLVDVAVELLRQERCISSAHAQSNHYKIYGQAEREFQIRSVKGQSKFDRLAVNKFGSKDKSEVGDGTQKSVNGDLVSPTLAVVTLNYAIRGDSTKMTNIFTRDDLKSALSQISADASVGDALIAAEVLWSPEDVTETLEPDVAYADFPQLVPI